MERRVRYAKGPARYVSGYIGELYGSPNYRLPVKYEPFEGELFSSFISRVALKYDISARHFISLILGDRKFLQVGYRDPDLYIKDELLKIIAFKTRNEFEQLYDTTLKSYQGILFESVEENGRTINTIPYIDRFKNEGGVPQKYGVKICPLCLKEEKEPYFKKLWRISFYNACHIHGIVLLDKCPKCGAPIRIIPTFSQEFASCFKCGFRFKNVSEYAKASNEHINAIRGLLKVIEDGYFQTADGDKINSLAFFIAFRFMARWVAKVMRTKNIKSSEINLAVEYLSLEDKLTIYTTAWEAFKTFPYSFRRFISESGLTIRKMASIYYRNIKVDRKGERFFKHLPYFLAKELERMVPPYDAQIYTKEGLKSMVFCLLDKGYPPSTGFLTKFNQTIFDKSKELLEIFIEYYTPELPKDMEQFFREKKTASADEVLKYFSHIKPVDVIRVMNYMIKSGKLKILQGSEYIAKDRLSIKKLSGPVTRQNMARIVLGI